MEGVSCPKAPFSVFCHVFGVATVFFIDDVARAYIRVLRVPSSLLQIPRIITLGQSGLVHLMPVELAGWLLRVLNAEAGVWVLILSTEGHLPAGLAMRGSMGVNITLGLTQYTSDELEKVKETSPFVVGRVKQSCHLPRVQWGEPRAAVREGRGHVSRCYFPVSPFLSTLSVGEGRSTAARGSWQHGAVQHQSPATAEHWRQPEEREGRGRGGGEQWRRVGRRHPERGLDTPEEEVPPDPEAQGEEMAASGRRTVSVVHNTIRRKVSEAPQVRRLPCAVTKAIT